MLNFQLTHSDDPNTIGLSVRTSCKNLARFMVVAAWALCDSSAPAQAVIPDFYSDPGMYPNRGYVNQNTNEHIDPFNGSLQWHFADIFLPGNGGFDLKVMRSDNSAAVDPHSAFLGVTWTRAST